MGREEQALDSDAAHVNEFMGKSSVMLGASAYCKLTRRHT